MDAERVDAERNLCVLELDCLDPKPPAATAYVTLGLFLHLSKLPYVEKWVQF